MELYRTDTITNDFAKLETRVVEMTRKLGVEILGSVIEKRDDGASSLKRDGYSWHRLPRSRARLPISVPVIVVAVTESRCPVDESLGLLAGSMTLPAGKLALSMVAESPPRGVWNCFEQAGGMKPSVSSLQRLLSSIHWAWQGMEDDGLEEIRSRETIPREASSVVLSLNGAMVPLRKDEQPLGLEATTPSTGSNWRAAACGTITFHDPTGRTLRTISSGQMPESNKLSLKHWLTGEIEPILHERPDLTFATVADGTLDNWSYLSGLCSEVEILDFYHATTHLSNAAQHAVSTRDWYAKWRSILRHERGGVDRVIRAIRGLHERAYGSAGRYELRTILKYFGTHRHRMNHAVFSQRGIPIGSGVVEAANKTHIGARLKRSGMRWGMARGQAVLTFRSLVKSDRFDHAWELIMSELDNRKPVNDNWGDNCLEAIAA